MAEQEFQNQGAAPQGDEKVMVYSGNNHAPVAAGKTVAEIRKQTKKVLNIGPDTKALVNGALVEDEESFVVQAGMQVEFVKAAGQKG